MLAILGAISGTAIIDTVGFLGVKPTLKPALREALEASLASVAGLNIVKTKDPKLIQAVNVDYKVKCFLIKSGNRILVRLMVEDKQGKAVFNSAYTASSERDIPYVFDLLALALREGKDPKELEKTVAEELGIEPRRVSYGSLGLYFGSITPYAHSFGRGVSTLYGGLLTLNYEIPHFMGQWATGRLWNKGGTYNWSISLIFINWFPRGYENISPYLSLGGGLNYTEYYVSDTAWPPTRKFLYGWGGYAGGGVMFFRRYDFRLVFDVKGVMLFNKVPDEVKHPAAGLDYPLGLNISIALLYHPTTYITSEEIQENISCCLFY